MNITVFDVFALFLALKCFNGFCNTKRKMVAVDMASSGIFLFCYIFLTQLGLDVYNEFLILCTVLLISLDFCYIWVNSGNKKSIVVLFSFIFCLYILQYCRNNSWLYLLLIIPILAHVLACDCSGAEGYTTLNAVEAVGYVLFTGVIGAWFPFMVSIVYLICSLLSYLKVNKLNALKAGRKTDEQVQTQAVHLNRAARREKARQERRKSGGKNE